MECICNCELHETFGKHICECDCPDCMNKLTDEEASQLQAARRELDVLSKETACHSCRYAWFAAELIGSGLCRRKPPVNHLVPEMEEQSGLARPVATPQVVNMKYDTAFPKIYRNWVCGEWLPGENYTGKIKCTAKECTCKGGK